MNIQVHDTTGASLYELVFSHKARTVIFPTQQNAIVLEENLADEGIDVGISSEQAAVISTSQHQAFRSEEDANTDVEQDAQCSMKSSYQGSTTQNVVNEAEDTLPCMLKLAQQKVRRLKGRYWKRMTTISMEMNSSAMERGNAYEKMHCPNR